MNLSRHRILIVLILGGCIQPFNVHLQSSPGAMVVNGLITNEPGPYTVLLYSTLALDDAGADIPWIKEAVVTIYDDQGAEEKLQEVTPGHYQTSVIHGMMGRTYHITITTSEGNSYQSSAETLLPVGNLTIESPPSFQLNESPPSDSPFTLANGFNVYLNSKILPEQNGLVRWRWTGTYKVHTYPEQRLKVKSHQGANTDKPTLIPDPPPCSGYKVDPYDPTQIDLVGPCTCCDCWVEQYNVTPMVSDRQFINNDSINLFNIAFIPVNRRTFYEKYYLEVQQMSVSPVVYDFWKKAEQENQTGSSLFQTPPAQSAGNIQNVTAGAIPALGVFSASAIKRQSIVMTPAEVPYQLPLIDSVKNSCFEYTNSSNIKPSFW